MSPGSTFVGVALRAAGACDEARLPLHAEVEEAMMKMTGSGSNVSKTSAVGVG
jgi:hypothetical protein